MTKGFRLAVVSISGSAVTMVRQVVQLNGIFLENTVELDDLTYHHDGRLRDRDYHQTKDIHRVYTTV